MKILLPLLLIFSLLAFPLISTKTFSIWHSKTFQEKIIIPLKYFIPTSIVFKDSAQIFLKSFGIKKILCALFNLSNFQV
jgi:hypothetical protein